jgi:hypothetical protein
MDDLAALAARVAAGEALPAQADAWPAAERDALGWALKAACQDAWNSAPQQAEPLAAALAGYAARAPTPTLAALADWTAGIAALLGGRMDEALRRFDAAGAALAALGRVDAAAQTQVPKTVALALLGRHVEALACAEAAHAKFLAAGDERSAGKVELNLGSMLMGQDRHEEAVRRYRQAAVRFARLADLEHSVMADVGLATALTWLFRFDEAELGFGRARMRADTHGLPVLAALARGGLGQLALHRGDYPLALRELEAGARGLAAGGAPRQQQVEAERELADAYLGLNLLAEAGALYERVIAGAAELDAPLEQAWAEAHLARALGGRAPDGRISELLDAARARFVAQDNAVGAAVVDLQQAVRARAAGAAAAAATLATQAAGALRAAGLVGWALDAERQAAEALLDTDAAAALPRLDALRAEAEAAALPAQAAACRVALGLALERLGRLDDAAAQIEAAAALHDAQRDALPGDELRTRYGADKQAAGEALVRLALKRGGDDRAAAVLRWTERARARALHAGLGRGDAAADEAVLQPLRTRLQWLEHQARLALAEGDERLADWERQAAEAEAELLERRRRLRIAAGGPAPASAPEEVDPAALAAALPRGAALLSWFLLGSRWLACVVTRDGLQLVEGDASGLAAEIAQARFQIDALRFGDARLAPQMPQLVERARLRLQALHRRLVAPLAPLLGGCDRLLLLPHGGLNGLPFAALHDGREHWIDRFDIGCAPSAAAWLAMSRRAPRPLAHTLVAGHGEGLPQVAAELAAVAAALGPGATVLGDGAATRAAVAAAAEGAGCIHLACHGRFRADNPRFSSLALADGDWTLFDIEALRLDAELVCLSACETAQGELAPGDELLGLTRGFLLAGAANVISTLWTVGDDSCARLMADVHVRRARGATPTAALCAAQRALAASHPHPYHWAAYTVNGRG